ncbi:MAG: SsrA-binding protein SmpB [bacterium]|nr:SsrA-binding protein SmpB [bacterium]
MPAPPDPHHRVVASNRKALHEFHILDTLDVGIGLVGTEVKSIRGGQISIREAYVRAKKGELWLVGAHIPEYAFGNKQNHEPVRDRKLLARRREIDKWHKGAREQGITMIPLEVFFDRALVKVRIGLCKGKKLYDKRASTKEKQDKREMDRALKRRR